MPWALILLIVGPSLVHGHSPTCLREDLKCDIDGSSLLQKHAIVKHTYSVALESMDEESMDDESMDVEAMGSDGTHNHTNLLELLGMRRAATPITDKHGMQTRILNRHNMYRCMHGVPPVRWSEAIANGAEDYIKSKAIDPAGPSRYKLRMPLGAADNLASSNTGFSKIERSIDMWYEECTRCKTGDPSSFTDGCAEGKACNVGKECRKSPFATGHFTAMIWKGVNEIGCALSDNGRILICRYCAFNGLDTCVKWSPNSPNGLLRGHWERHVLVRTKTANECFGPSWGVDPTEAPTVAPPGAPYIETKYGSTACPSAYSVIADEAACKKAAVALGKSWRFARKSGWSNIQFGCFTLQNKRTYFNKLKGRTRRKFANICHVWAPYIYTKYGSTSCPSGYSVIADEAACKKAAVALGKSWRGNNRNRGWSYIQFGCFTGQDRRVNFNKLKGQTHSKIANICHLG
jgi:hypothetical protein